MTNIDNIKNVLIKDGDNEFNFEVVRLKPFDQMHLLLKVIGIAAKGSLTAPKQIEALFHNTLQTGVNIDVSKEPKYEGQTMTMLFDAVKGALATLEDKERDYLINTLLSKVTLINDVGRFPVNADELNKRFSGFMPIITLLREVAMINFMQSGIAKG